MERRDVVFGGVRLMLDCRTPHAMKETDSGQEGLEFAYQNDSTGQDVWTETAEQLCGFLETNRDAVVGSCILELGAGMGCVGLVAGKLGATRCVLSDKEAGVVALLTHNIALNHLSHSCTAQQIDFSRPPHTLSDLFPSPAPTPPHPTQTPISLVLGAELLYFDSLGNPLANMISHALATLPAPCIALLGHTERCAVTWDARTHEPVVEPVDTAWEKFKEACQVLGLGMRVLRVSEDGKVRLWGVHRGEWPINGLR